MWNMYTFHAQKAQFWTALTYCCMEQLWLLIAYNLCWFVLEVFVSLMFLITDFHFAHFTGRRNHVSFVVKASGESSESSTTLTVFKSVQNIVSFSFHSHPSRLSSTPIPKLLFVDFKSVGSTWGPTGTYWFGICSRSSVLGINKFDCGNLHHFQCFGNEYVVVEF